MALNIKDPEADRLARELAALTGESITAAVTSALRERIDRCKQRERMRARRAALEAIQERVSTLPVLDDRSDEEIIGYNEFGAFD
jgi:antitoxin VapB